MRRTNPRMGRPDLAPGRARAEPRGLTRRQWLTLALEVSALAFAGPSRADEPRVPVRLQAELLAKVAAYDTRFSARARDRALVLIVQATGLADSERFAASIRAELGMQARIGGILHMEQIIHFASAAELARVCRERLPAIVYLAPGLSSAATAIADALSELDLISVSPVPPPKMKLSCALPVMRLPQ